jgi:ATP-dependent exoDNAse (exonuclease V) beta subunit
MSFTVYKSSAGSGKTFTLVKEYLKLALTDAQEPPVKYKRILAITFTNKAAAEMKERVLKALKELAGEENKMSAGSRTLLQILVNETKIPAPLLSMRAQNVLQAILHNYSEFAIGTIDSFVHRVVRTFAFDLRIPMNFEIETDADKLLTQAIDLLISRVGTDEKLTKALVEFTEAKTDEEKSWHIENDLKRFAANLLREDGSMHIDRLRSLTTDDFFKIRATLAEETKKFEAAIKSTAQKGVELIELHDLDPSSFYQGTKGIPGYFKNAASGRFEMLKPNSYVQTTLGEDKWTSGKATGQDKAAIEAVKPQLTDLFSEIQRIADEGYADYILFTLINRNIYSLAVLNEIEKLLTDFKEQNNILHISEFNRLISGVVLEQPVPFIYERLGEKYSHYLIDEFQDTSLLQWHNLLPLIDNSLSESNFNMIVGDGKQAIYRWRGGEVEQFARLPEIHKHNDNPFVLEREEGLKRHHEPKHLNKNFRSKREIIEFNNDFFRALSYKLDDNYKNIYEQLEQEFDPEKTGGYVSVEFLEGEKDELYLVHLDRTLELVKKLQEDKYALRDIAVLVRRNTDGSEIAAHLTSHGIPVVSSDSLLLKNSHHVTFIVSFMEYLADHSNGIAKASVLQYLLATGGIKEELHHSISKAIHSGGWKVFNDFLAANNFAFSNYILAKLPLYELCEEIVRIFGLNRTADPYVQFFLDETLAYAAKNINNLEDFLEWWKDPSNQPSIAVPGAADAVTIMTIHRSKGLEFPAVIIPFASWRVGYGNDNLWIDIDNAKIPQLETAIVPTTSMLEDTPYRDAFTEEKNKSMLDHLNVLYVAMTRPEERLYLLSSSPSKNPANLGSITDMLAYYFIDKEEYSSAKRVYEFGKAEPHAAKAGEEGQDAYRLTSVNTTNWRERIKIRTSAPEMWNTEDPTAKKNANALVRTALTRAGSREDVKNVLTAMLNEGLIDKDEQKQFSDKITSLFKEPALVHFFDPEKEVKIGADILSPSGESYKPARVVIENNKATVIDFSTGNDENRLKKQLATYSKLLIEMGYTDVKKMLIHIDKESLEEVNNPPAGDQLHLF